MPFLITEAFDLTREFEASIKRDFGVVVRDRRHQPYGVVFEGERSKLVQMYNREWIEGGTEPPVDIDTDMIVESYTASAAVGTESSPDPVREQANSVAH